jgi:hypothetical protein
MTICMRVKMLEIRISNIRNCFNNFATGAMWRESWSIMFKVMGAKYFRYSYFGQLLPKPHALFSPDTREFVILICVKQNDKK